MGGGASPLLFLLHCGVSVLPWVLPQALLSPFAEQICIFVVLISVTLTLGFWSKVTEFKTKHYYVPRINGHSLTTESIFILLSFIILLSVMMPMAMFIT